MEVKIKTLDGKIHHIETTSKSISQLKIDFEQQVILSPPYRTKLIHRGLV